MKQDYIIMAHVLLPCDMPNWIDVQRHLSHLRLARTAEELASRMQKLYSMCSVHLDPEEPIDASDPSRFEVLQHYLEHLIPEKARTKFFKVSLPKLINNALRLKVLKPLEGFHYSLQQEDKVIALDRKFVASLVANAFFSTFPKRTSKTHPTLQDFNFGDFFCHMKRPEQQTKLEYIFHYFECLEVDDLKGNVKFYRQSLQPTLSLPFWLCSERPLCPLIVRSIGKIEDAEPNLYKACFCSSKIGGDVLREGSNMEAMSFCRMPELLAAMSFVEALCDNEALIAEGLIHLTVKNSTNELMKEQVDVCLMDAKNFSTSSSRQYEDSNLLRDMNKAFIAFNQPLSRHRPVPVGQSSSSSMCMEHLEHSESPPILPKQNIGILITPEMISLQDIVGDKQTSKVPYKASKVPSNPIEPTNISVEKPKMKHVSIASKSSTTSECFMDALDTFKNRGSSASSTVQRPLGLLTSECVKAPVKKQRSHSTGAIHNQPSLEEIYFTASEGDDLDAGLKLKRRKSKSSWKRNSLRQYSDESRCSRDSMGFVLDGASDDEDRESYLSKHERYEDFRQRIRRRSRRLSKKGSRSSWLSSSGSSDMEDILEDTEYTASSLRQSNSEPSLLKFFTDEPVLLPPVPLVPEALSLSMSKKKIMITTTNGQLKAYSYDGVKPNLPVPFKAKFRRRRGSDESELLYHSFRDSSLWQDSSGEEGSLKDVKDIDEYLDAKFSTSQSTTSGSTCMRDLLTPNSEGIRPVVTGNWGCGHQCGDVQLKAIIQWLAASMATLPCLVYYTDGTPELKKFEKVIKRCQKLEWKLGDLACETLRYCRNRTSGRNEGARSTSIFVQLLAGDSFLSNDSLE